MSKVSPSADARSDREPGRDDLAPLRPAKLVLAENGTIGEALRAARESLGLAVEDIALVTRVGAAHLASLEAFELDDLPARPFAIGYVRAYAQALGLDAEAVVARFRAEAPAGDSELGEPMGLGFQARRGFGAIAAVIGLVVAGVVGWNLLVHFKTAPAAAHAELAPPRTALLPANPPPAQLGAPLPAPPEATTPAAYETPGLLAAVAAKTGGQPAAAKADAALVPPLDPGRIGLPFLPQGAVYGAPRGAAGPVLQARQPTSLVVRGAGGVVYFARQLAAGEAWRAPDTPGLTVDVGNPASMEVYVQGLSRGPLASAKMPVAKLGG